MYKNYDSRECSQGVYSCLLVVLSETMGKKMIEFNIGWGGEGILTKQPMEIDIKPHGTNQMLAMTFQV
jgi:hypothetical protein